MAHVGAAKPADGDSDGAIHAYRDDSVYGVGVYSELRKCQCPARLRGIRCEMMESDPPLFRRRAGRATARVTRYCPTSLRSSGRRRPGRAQGHPSRARTPTRDHTNAEPTPIGAKRGIRQRFGAGSVVPRASGDDNGAPIDTDGLSFDDQVLTLRPWGLRGKLGRESDGFGKP
jgi:hypothetical protein